ncbi:hypothetical protein LINPERPRIM_LOCUS26197 [Linum perenne]
MIGSCPFITFTAKLTLMRIT